MLIDPSAEQTTYWKDKLVGQSSKSDGNGIEEEEDYDLLETDIQNSIVNSISSIEFSDRIHQILIEDMENTVILKLLGLNIRYSILQNKVYSLWKPSSSFHLMDIENGYFLAKFQNKLDYEKILYGGPWIIFGQYLIVQPWTVAFNPAQAFSKVVMSWIRLPDNGHVKEACAFRASECITRKEPPPLEISPENHNKVVDGTGIASGSSVGPGSSSRIADDVHLMVSESIKSPRKKSMLLDLNGSLGGKALSNMNKDMDGLEKHENGGAIKESCYAPQSEKEGSVDDVTAVMVGSLDPNKNMVVIFKENRDPKDDSRDEENTGMILKKGVVRALGREMVINSEVEK
ncbi:hypothetical protein GOBAR_DD07912 [Gossypium barbadense]|nr:hypothetical protein GOBAR_DD07912 [Gossypium barbadense]